MEVIMHLETFLKTFYNVIFLLILFCSSYLLSCSKKEITSDLNKEKTIDSLFNYDSNMVDIYKSLTNDNNSFNAINENNKKKSNEDDEFIDSFIIQSTYIIDSLQIDGENYQVHIKQLILKDSIPSEMTIIKNQKELAKTKFYKYDKRDLYKDSQSGTYEFEISSYFNFKKLNFNKESIAIFLRQAICPCPAEYEEVYINFPVLKKESLKLHSHFLDIRGSIDTIFACSESTVCATATIYQRHLYFIYQVFMIFNRTNMFFDDKHYENNYFNADIQFKMPEEELRTKFLDSILILYSSIEIEDSVQFLISDISSFKLEKIFFKSEDIKNIESSNCSKISDQPHWISMSINGKIYWLDDKNISELRKLGFQMAG